MDATAHGPTGDCDLMPGVNDCFERNLFDRRELRPGGNHAPRPGLPR